MSDLPPDDVVADDSEAGSEHDVEYVDAWREAPPGHRRLLMIVLGAAAVFVVLLGAGGIWVQRQVNPPGPAGTVHEIEIPSGSTSADIGRQLADEGIIASNFVWSWYLRIKGGGPFQAGLYELAEHSSIGQVIEVLEAGPRPPDERSFTIPEGLTTAEIVARLADPDKGLGLDAAVMKQLLDSGQVRSTYQPAGQTSSEGILLPETYRVDKDATELQVLTLLVEELDATLNGLDVSSAQTRFNLTPYEVLTVASLIEEEAKVPEERAKMARVMYNRLKQGIPLGVDATSRYEAVLNGQSRGQVDFTSDSPYNTRRHLGLPPTPIASPGRASIAAALHPADGPWIYYVLEDADGHHFFTDSSSEFIKAKRRCAEQNLGCG